MSEMSLTHIGLSGARSDAGLGQVNDPYSKNHMSKNKRADGYRRLRGPAPARGETVRSTSAATFLRSALAARFQTAILETYHRRAPTSWSDGKCLSRASDIHPPNKSRALLWHLAREVFMDQIQQNEEQHYFRAERPGAHQRAPSTPMSTPAEMRERAGGVESWCTTAERNSVKFELMCRQHQTEKARDGQERPDG
ncbi:hypothetical protein FKP32DRAFT_16078 [Trametes sanguinea]|nr:hypothetical protein FKP32DRAFT_16078 [Trametes sanguinea]